ncbi:MAG: type I methionyl aminopeptidase, partial [Candidatus Yanofskybacteria bacterium]|nr:type I methionyl aminopeptidase [Candidatus Yanofskybacteria bacterium]
VKLKTKEDIKIMKEGGEILAKILRRLKEEVKPGINTFQLEKLARELVLSYGVEPSFLGFENYPAVLCASVNEEIVHGLPSERVLNSGDILKLDMGVYHNGFHTDSAVTLLVGSQNDKVVHNFGLTPLNGVRPQKLISVTREALDIGIGQAKVGNTTGDIGAAIQEFVRKNGFEVIQDLVGHGIGKELHEWPQVPNFGKRGYGDKLVPGMVIAIEPMVVTGKKRTKIGKDGFSHITADKGLAAHFEHTVAITDKGPLILTQ